MVQIYAGLDLVSFSKNACYNCNQFPKKNPKNTHIQLFYLALSFHQLCRFMFGSHAESPALA